MAFKFNWKRILVNSGLSALAILMEELSKHLPPDPPPSPQRMDTVDSIGPEGWPEESGLGKSR